jgi:hypothetical protein
MSEKSEFQKFDAVITKVLSVSREELAKREKAWRRKRTAKNKITRSSGKPATK